MVEGGAGLITVGMVPVKHSLSCYLAPGEHSILQEKSAHKCAC